MTPASLSPKTIDFSPKTDYNMGENDDVWEKGVGT